MLNFFKTKFDFLYFFLWNRTFWWTKIPFFWLLTSRVPSYLYLISNTHHNKNWQFQERNFSSLNFFVFFDVFYLLDHAEWRRMASLAARCATDISWRNCMNLNYYTGFLYSLEFSQYQKCLQFVNKTLNHFVW